jgi:hypothetical protein
VVVHHAVALAPNGHLNLSNFRYGKTREKNVKITIKIRTDYEYANEIGILFAVSHTPIFIPLLARSIFLREAGTRP